MTEYVYCLSNPDYIENLYKIGYTNNPVRRAEELYSTGVPTKFVIEFVIKTTDGKGLEKIIHDKLKDYRHNSHREFFKIPMTTLKNILETVFYDNTIEINNSVFGPNPMIEPEVISNTHFECECGSSVLITNKARHFKSPGHLIMKTNESAIEKEVEKTYKCECGSSVLISNKARHLKSQSHNAKKEGDEKEEEKEEVPKKEPYSKDYICGCGKRVFKSNKFNHNHASYHTDWVNQYIIDTVETD